MLAMTIRLSQDSILRLLSDLNSFFSGQMVDHLGVSLHDETLSPSQTLIERRRHDGRDEVKRGE